MNEVAYIQRQMDQLEFAMMHCRLAMASNGLNRYNHLSRADKELENVRFQLDLLMNKIETEHATSSDVKTLDNKNRAIYRPITSTIIT